MKTTLYLLLCAWAMLSSAGMEVAAEGETPGAVKDQEEAMNSLEDALPPGQHAVRLDGREGNEGMWRQKPPWLGIRGQPTWQEQGCGIESPVIASQALEPDNPTALRFWDTASQESHRSSDIDNTPTTEGMAPSSLDTITSCESLNLILPSEDDLKLLSKKSLNVSLSNGASPDFHTASTHLVSSSSKLPTKQEDQPEPFHYKEKTPYDKSYAPTQPFPPPLASNSPPQRSKIASCPQIVPRSPQRAAPTLRSSGPTPVTEKCLRRSKKKVVTSPCPTCCKCKACTRGVSKRSVIKTKPKSRSCGCLKPTKKRTCKEAEPFRRISQPKTCRRPTCEVRIKQKKHKTRKIQATECNGLTGSKEQRSSEFTPKRNAEPSKMVIYFS